MEEMANASVGMERVDEITNEINGLKSLLRDTDYTSNKIIESMVQTMQDATLTNFIKKFVEWLTNAVKDFGPVIRDRAAWRARINELEDELEKLNLSAADEE